MLDMREAGWSGTNKNEIAMNLLVPLMLKIMQQSQV
uniref:Uncharacterized protein n=1 Tax=Arundo donax TaxID=35708 RepID=A0A0A8ZD07_ARUDO